MNGRVTFLLLSVGVLAFACARPQGADLLASRAEKSVSRKGGPALTPNLAVEIGDRVRFGFTVANTGSKKLELSFRTGQTHELVVLDSLGREVWRWSKDRMFTSALQTKVLRQQDSFDYNAEWSDARPGRYTAVATLASMNYPMEQRAEFVVPR